MELDYNVFVNKTKIMLKTIKEEYEIIIQNYSEEKIIKKSYSIKSRDSLNNKEKEYVDSILEQFFEPSLKQISILIDSGIISWDSAIEPISLNDINKDIEDFKHLIYESWEKLYVYKHIKYDLIMSFIIQIYLFTEKEIAMFLKQKYTSENLNTMFSCINVIEKEGKYIDKDIKAKIDMYRNIINVYKHGKGKSFDELKEKNCHVLNSCYDSNDLSFVFNLKFVSFEELYNTLINFINEL